MSWVEPGDPGSRKLQADAAEGREDGPGWRWGGGVGSCGEWAALRPDRAGGATEGTWPRGVHHGMVVAAR